MGEFNSKCATSEEKQHDIHKARQGKQRGHTYGGRRAYIMAMKLFEPHN
jgi:hypothetical protein